MFIETVPNRTSPPAVLLRESYRDEQGRAQKRTLANLSKLPGDVIDGLKALLKGGTVIGTGPDEMQIERSLPHGHVAAALGMLRRIALDRLILSTAKDAASRRHCDLVVAMIVDRLITPRSKLGFVRAVDEETATTSLGAVLRLGEVKEREAYEALDWLLERQRRIENGLARRHLQDGVLVLYDVSSSYFEGRCCPLAQHGYSRDHRGDRPQIVYGLLCTREGLPVAVEVFDGNTADPATLSAQVEKLKDRFGISRVVLVGDRGMITSARIGDRPQAGRRGLDHLPAGTGHSGAGGGERAVAAVAVRRARPGRDQRARDVPRRAADCLPQPRTRRRTRAQARGTAGRHRTRACPHPGAGPPQALAAAQRRRDRPGSRRRGEQSEDGQALRHRDPRRPLRLPAPDRTDRDRRPASTAST